MKLPDNVIVHRKRLLFPRSSIRVVGLLDRLPLIVKVQWSLYALDVKIFVILSVFTKI